MLGTHGTVGASPVNAPSALPRGSSAEFRQLYERGEVPHFGFYKPLYLHSSLAASTEAESCFFPPLFSVLSSRARVTDAAASGDGEDDHDGNGSVETAPTLARCRHGWEVVRSVEELWNGGELQTKIPPAADYERMLLDRVWRSEEDEVGKSGATL